MQPPSTPPIRPLVASTRLEGGDRGTARRVLQELGKSEVGFIRQAAARALSQVDAMDLIDAVQARVEAYYATRGTYPTSWRDLVNAGYVRAIPLDPGNTPLVYDADSHTVRLAETSPLFPLPRYSRAGSPAGQGSR